MSLPNARIRRSLLAPVFATVLLVPASQALAARTVHHHAKRPAIKLIHRPAHKTTSVSATFAWKTTASGRKFRCSLDGRRAKPCTTRVKYNHLRPGGHRFVVRAVGRPVRRPVRKPVTKPVTKPIGTTATQPVAQPVTQPVSQPVSPPVSQPVTPPVTKTATWTVTPGTTGSTGGTTSTPTAPVTTAPPTTGAPVTNGPGVNTFGKNIFGIATGSTLQNDSASDLTGDLNLDQKAGAGWVRIDINWAQIQVGGPNSYNWSYIDNAVTSAEARGMSVLGTIVYTPNWSRPAGTDGTDVTDPQEYAAFAAVAAKHYSALGVQDFEIWNEPNQIGSWTPKPNVAAYTTLLKDSYTSIKAVDPSATVITGGLSPAASDGTNIAPVDFLKGIYADGGQGFFDAVGMHPYCNPDMPGQADSGSAWYQMYGTPTSLRSLMVANGDGAKKIWGTEFGTPTSGLSGVSAAFQAQTVTRAYQLWSTYSWAGPLFFYEGRDNGTDSNDSYDNYGFATTTFAPKPSFYAFQSAAASL
jgi:polysaccharide biosynthesis protein PslG